MHLHIFSAEIPMNKILYLQEQLTFLLLTSLLSCNNIFNNWALDFYQIAYCDYPKYSDTLTL